MDYTKSDAVLPFVEVQNLNITYKQRGKKIEAAKNINFEILAGEFCVIIGPSGCGKSSLLYVLSGLLEPEQGEVLIEGLPLVSRRNDTSLILQEYGLLPWKTVEQNVALGLLIRGDSRKKANEKAHLTLKNLGILDLAKRFPAQLSGGQRQRVAIARSLVLQPRLLLMDEPFSSLDALTREGSQNFLLNIWRGSPISILLVTHSIEEAVYMGQRIFVMSPNPGTITHIVNNPLAADDSYRGKNEFHSSCTKLRELLQKAHQNRGMEFAEKDG